MLNDFKEHYHISLPLDTWFSMTQITLHRRRPDRRHFLWSYNRTWTNIMNHNTLLNQLSNFILNPAIQNTNVKSINGQKYPTKKISKSNEMDWSSYPSTNSIPFQILPACWYLRSFLSASFSACNLSLVCFSSSNSASRPVTLAFSAAAFLTWALPAAVKSFISLCSSANCWELLYVSLALLCSNSLMLSTSKPIAVSW